jgi:hypothetical protein
MTAVSASDGDVMGNSYYAVPEWSGDEESKQILPAAASDHRLACTVMAGVAVAPHRPLAIKS